MPQTLAGSLVKAAAAAATAVPLSLWFRDAAAFRRNLRFAHALWDLLAWRVRHETDLAAAEATGDTSLRVCLTQLKVGERMVGGGLAASELRHESWGRRQLDAFSGGLLPVPGPRIWPSESVRSALALVQRHCAPAAPQDPATGEPLALEQLAPHVAAFLVAGAGGRLPRHSQATAGVRFYEGGSLASLGVIRVQC